MANERTLPMLLLNLGGEMVYILEQRLQAQRVPQEKADKVLLDICRLLLHDRFMVELLVPQPLGHVAALRTFFRDLAHASIMRLDDDSMSKMWDLMTMAVKQQALRADSPGELLQATLNHIEYMGEHVPGVAAEAEQARQGLLAFYSRMPSGELQAVRYGVLNYLQGLAVRVSLYLKHGLQDMHGRLLVPKDGPVPPGCEPPGTMRIMDGGGREVDTVVQVLHFPAGGQFTSPARDAGPGGNTELGCNLYSEFEDPGGVATA
ncbi:protein OSCP1, partial [Thrips palmi]|uniref:Protein OSCP1 n=1 Tax=Thrips palmi TaxID=161013 RepID=A0A6P8YY60_THRPL